MKCGGGVEVKVRGREDFSRTIRVLQRRINYFVVILLEQRSFEGV